MVEETEKSPPDNNEINIVMYTGSDHSIRNEKDD